MRLLKTHDKLNKFGIPLEYTRVEYLESTGTQYIDTGVNADSDLGFDVSYKWDTFNTANSRFLGVIKQDGTTYLRHHSSDSSSSFAYFVSTEKTDIQTVATTGFHTFKYDSVSKNFNYDGTEIAATTPTTFNVGLNFWLFGRNGNIESLKSYASVKIHSAKLYDKSTLVRDFIPVLDNVGRPAMYDKVSKQLFYNAGTGEFNYGRQIIPVKYLESFRPNTSEGYALTQYIDTKIIPNQNTKIILDAEMTKNYTTSSASDYYETLIGSFKSPVGFRIHYHINSGKGYFGYILGSSSNSYTNLVEADLNRHIFVLDAKNSVFSIDNNSYQSSYSMSGEQNPMALFAQRGTSAFNASANMKCYGCKIYNDNTLVRDFIPCKDENNVGFMLDTVESKVYLNIGTGSFVVGEEAYDYKDTVRFLKDKIIGDLPRGYTRVEYLESSGTQYIDTGYKPNTNTRTVGRVRFNSFVGSPANYIFGVFSSPNNYGFNIGAARQYFNVPWGTSSGIKLNIIPHLNTDYEFDISKTGYLINGQSYGDVSAESVNSTRNMYLFWSNGTSASGMNGRIYYCKIYDNDTLVRDFIPAIDPLGVPCMYDLIEKKAYYNRGTGNFKGGNAVSSGLRLLWG